MPRSRARGGTRMPRPGDDTTLPPIEISPPVGCSRPATQRSVVVLPQPDGPSSTTISPAGTAKLTPSIAGRPIANCFLRPVTSSGAVMPSPNLFSLPVAEGLVPIGDPWAMQLHILLEVRIPDLDHLGIETFRKGRGHLERRQIALLLDHEGLPLLRQRPVQIESPGVDMRRGLRNAARIRVGRHPLRREYRRNRRAILLLGKHRIVDQRPHRDLP